jgi:hypothetical protein
MDAHLLFEISPQPDDTACGPTCLHSIYRYFGDRVSLKKVISETRQLQEGGTLAVFLGCHALRRGYKATIYTYNLNVFDPTWFNLKPKELALKLIRQARAKHSPKLFRATEGYLEFLKRGGAIKFEELTPRLILNYLKQRTPILTGLSSTYLYRCSREYGSEPEYDDVRGVPTGHFVVLFGYDDKRGKVLVADPMADNPLEKGLYYKVRSNRLICSILLGVLTYDANLLVIEPDSKGVCPI